MTACMKAVGESERVQTENRRHQDKSQGGPLSRKLRKNAVVEYMYKIHFVCALKCQTIQNVELIRQKR